MPKILIAEACTLAGEEFSTHADVGEEVSVSKDDAAALCRMGRAYYLDRDDDPSKGKFTATADDKKRVAGLAKAIKAEVEARTAKPVDVSAQVAAEVAKALAAAGVKPAA